MLRYILVSLGGGILFGVLDAVINANPLAQSLLEVYRPIARTSVNAPAGIVIDLVYGFALAAIFLLLYPSLPGGAGWIKGLSFGALAWFLRTFMGAASQWVMFKVPGETLLYTLTAGAIELLLIGLLLGLALKPAN